MEKVKIDPFAILGITDDAGDKDIQSAYRKKSRQCHPDLFPNNEEKAEEFRKLNKAYELINTADKRRLFSQKSGASLRQGAEGAHTSFYKRMFRVEQ